MGPVRYTQFQPTIMPNFHGLLKRSVEIDLMIKNRTQEKRFSYKLVWCSKQSNVKQYKQLKPL